MRHPVNQVAVRREEQETRCRPIKTPCDAQGATSERLAQQFADERGFTIVFATGVTNGLVQHEVSNLGR
jgi:hypothetical protein